MQEIYQKTITNPIIFKGISLHSGLDSKITILPGSIDQGIIFKRIDLKENNLIKANYQNVSSAKLCTTLKNDHGVKVSTVEHLLAALYIAEIDNVIIEINNEEIPIMDGSAKSFVDSIQNAGFKISDQAIRIIKINKKVTYSEGEKYISFEPNKISLEIDFEIKYKQSSILNQRNMKNIYMDDLKDMYESRTFCLFEDVEKLKKMGLARGGSLDNAIVIKQNEILNKEKLRNPNEFVNHKILDCIGDLYTSGYRIIGSVICSQGGHYLTNQLLRKVFQTKDNYSIIEIKEKVIPHSYINKTRLKSIA